MPTNWNYFSRSSSLNITDCLHKLLNSAVVIALRVQVITILAMNVRYARIVKMLRLGEVEREKVERLPVQQIELCRGRLFFQRTELQLDIRSMSLQQKGGSLITLPSFESR